MNNVKILLYFEGEKSLAKSGIGQVIANQQRALDSVGIEWTTDENCKDYDILHINTYGPKSIAAVRKAHSKGKKVIYHGHSTEEDFKNSFLLSKQIAPLAKMYLTTLYKMADYIIAPTEYSKKLISSYGVETPISAVPNGIDLDKYVPRGSKEKAFHEQFEIKADEKVVISEGHCLTCKGLFDFIEVAERLPNYRFIWFGETSLASLPKKNRDAIKKNHPKNVEFAAGFKGDVIEGAYSAADCFLFPSFEETEGDVVLEALASKQNILVRDIPAYEGLLEDNKNCYMANDVDGFVEKLEGIVEKKLPDLSGEGYKTAQSCSINSIGKELEEVYRKVADIEHQSLNIGIFTDTYFPEVSGVATSIRTLRDELEMRGHNVYIFTTTSAGLKNKVDEDECIIRFGSIPFISFTDRRISMRGAAKAQQLAKKYKLDIIHTQTEFGMGVLGKVTAHTNKIPVLHTYHTLYREYLHYVMNGKLLKPIHVKLLFKMFLADVYGCICPSRRVEKEVRSYGIDKLPLRVIPTGIDINKFTQDDALEADKYRCDIREKHGYTDENIVLLSLGRLSYEKNIQAVISALPDMVVAKPEIRLLIVGEGPYHEDLANLASDLGVEDYVEFVGMINNDEVNHYYYAADYFVNASTSETQGLTYSEAMASSLQVIAHGNDYLEDLIDDPSLGSLFYSDDQIAQTTLDYIDSGIKMDADVLGDKLFEISTTNFGARVEQFYKETIVDYKNYKFGEKKTILSLPAAFAKIPGKIPGVKKLMKDTKND